MAPMRHRGDTAWTLEDVHECFHPGERWAYRANARAAFQEAEIHSMVPKRKPPRVRVILFDDGFEVKREAVPPGRLWAPWAQVEELRADDARWARVRSVQPAAHEARAAFWALIDERPGVFDFFDGSSGVALILDAPALAAELCLDPEDLQDPEGFEDFGGSVVGWTVVRKVARAALLVDDCSRARALICKINSQRTAAAEQVAERLRTKDWDPEFKYLPADHPAFDATVEHADDLERGLRSLVPGLIAVQEQEDARLLLDEAMNLMTRVRPELRRRDSPRRHGELLRELDGLVQRAARLGLRGIKIDEAGVAQSAESPQEVPRAAVAD